MVAHDRSLHVSAPYRACIPALISADDPDALPVAVEALRQGNAVVLPTDTVYGVAVLASMPGATAQLFALKGRPADVPLAVLVASADQAGGLVDVAPVRRLLDALWPGPLTVVLPRRAGFDAELGGDGRTVGLRCPDHLFVRTLAAEVGPLATTSANQHGEPTPSRAIEAATTLADDVAIVIDGGPCAGAASTVVDATTSELRVLREGPITRAQLDAFLPH